jgi:triphosphoribosyl-dephospho-CoA synthase
VAMLGGEGQSQAIADAAAALARLPDGFAPKSFSKGCAPAAAGRCRAHARKRSAVSAYHHPGAAATAAKPGARRQRAAGAP